MTIWVIDDDITLRKMVRQILTQEGFEVRAFDGPEGVVEALGDEEPELLLLDVRMPGKKGTDLCREIRAQSKVPIIFVSSAGDPIDRVVGLELGADDYITKPFHPKELVARVNAVLRRAVLDDDEGDDELLVVGDLSLDPTAIKVKYADSELPLTKTEFRLLQTLMEQPQKVFSRKELMAGAYEGTRVSKKTIDSHIRRLRTSFGSCKIDPIRTVRGVGYALDYEMLTAETESV
jgi:two-component system OmpR family response regulator